jgi:hypothetical protein
MCACGCGTEVARRFAKGHATKRPVGDRIAEKTRVDESGCWIFTGAVCDSGYGRIGISHRSIPVHRAAYEVANGPLRAGEHVDHLCRVRLCVNPDHLEAVSQAENNKRAGAARRESVARCKRDHPFDSANTIMRRGTRRCRTCEQWSREAARRGLGIQKYLDQLTTEGTE